MISLSPEIRAVLDTNIFVAAFKKPGDLASRIIKDDWPLNSYTLLTSMSIITEIVTVLPAARVPKKSIQGLVSLIMLYAQARMNTASNGPLRNTSKTISSLPVP